ncbi:MAG: hypothetical protein AAB736_00415 [Patescibacteria group bacterium]
MAEKIIIISSEVSYMRVIESSIISLVGGVEIVNPNFPEPIKSAEVAQALITYFKPEIILLDHFLSGTSEDRIMERIKMEDGEGVEIVDEISFLYIGEIKPIIISLSTRTKKELAPLYGRGVRHYPEGNMLTLTRCLKKECLC